jgi:hypothetical protein
MSWSPRTVVVRRIWYHAPLRPVGEMLRVLCAMERLSRTQRKTLLLRD